MPVRARLLLLEERGVLWSLTGLGLPFSQVWFDRMPTYVISLQGFQPGARFDGLPWTDARIEEGTTSAGPWTVLETQALSPVDADPTAPATRSFTTALATSPYGWFRVVFEDAANHEQASGSVYSSPVSYAVRGLTVQQLVDQVVDETGFDVTDTQALRWINARHRKMCARARSFRAIVQVGTATADQASYSVDADLVEMYELTVDGTPYERVALEDVTAGTAGLVTISSHGVFAATSDANGVSAVRLYPAPSESGAAIQLFGSMVPPDLALTDYPQVPVDFQDALVEGAIATGMARDAGQIGVADRFEARFDRACEELRRRTNSRLRGSSVTLRIVGINA